MPVSIVTLNIGNPSADRAARQIEWLNKQDFDIAVLTETKLSSGCLLIETFFSSRAGRYVYFPKSQTGDLGIMIISKFPISKINPYYDESNRFFCRFIDLEICIQGKILGIIGLYVPSRDQSIDKVIRKSEFIAGTSSYIENISSKKSTPYIICGDFNIISRDHYPKYSTFKSWEYDFYDKLQNLGYVDIYKEQNEEKNEYSWVGRTGNGYRYDYIFTSESFKYESIMCTFIHETRALKLTDHSAVMLKFSVT
jgi:exodeoxyribonuclease-3